MPAEIGLYSVEFLIGAVIGLLGQLVRLLIGIRTYTGEESRYTRRTGRWVVLLVLGAVAGGLAAFAFPWGGERAREGRSSRITRCWICRARLCRRTYA